MYIYIYIYICIYNVVSFNGCGQAKQLHWKFIHDPTRHQED